MEKSFVVFILAGSLSLLFCERTIAANAVFAADGKAVFTITDKADFPLNKTAAAPAHPRP